MGGQRHDLTGHNKGQGQDVDQNFGDQALAFWIPGKKKKKNITQVRKPKMGPQHRWRLQLNFRSRANW